MVTKLAIQCIPTKDSRFIRIADNSWYNPEIPVTCGILEITIPGRDCPVAFSMDKNFNDIFNSSMLELQTVDCHSQLTPLPEGVYKIKYSINPNNILYEEYYFLQNVQQYENYIRLSCSLFKERNSITKKEFEKRFDDLFWIKQLIETAKFKIEDCGELENGLELYDEANNLLNKISKHCKFC